MTKACSLSLGTAFAGDGVATFNNQGASVTNACSLNGGMAVVAACVADE